MKIVIIFLEFHNSSKILKNIYSLTPKNQNKNQRNQTQLTHKKKKKKKKNEGKKIP
jgi:hypothetical protein